MAANFAKLPEGAVSPASCTAYPSYKCLCRQSEDGPHRMLKVLVSNHESGENPTLESKDDERAARPDVRSIRGRLAHCRSGRISSRNSNAARLLPSSW